MKYVLPILLLLCSLTANAEPFEGWTTAEKTAFVASELALLADYKTTSSLLYPSQGYYEMNPIIGPQPSRQRLNLWFAGWMIGNYFIADNFDHNKRLTWLITLTVTESIAARHNVMIGGSIKF